MKRAIAIITVLVLCLCILPMAAFAADDVTLYLKPNSNWLLDNARFAVYVADSTWSTSTWYSMADSDSDGYYEVTIPAGNHYAIFCRMNPGTTENNWSNKWNQTADLVIPTDGANCYTVADGTWDKGNGQWSVFGSTTPSDPQPEPDPVYVVAGVAALCGSEWDGSDVNNQMTKNDDGTYSKTYENVPAGTYEFKIVLNGGIWIPDGMGNNQIVHTVTAGKVTITFNPADNTITVVAEGEPTEAQYFVAGNAALCGSDWDCADEANKMAKGDDGLYTITYNNLKPNTEYKFKITNGTWDSSWPSGDVIFAVAEAGSVTITFNPTDGSVTLSDNAIDYVPSVGTDDVLVVAGSAGLCGSEWDATSEANKMTEVSEGVYSITYTNVAAGNYELKVVLNGTTWIGGSDGNNVKITVTAACDVTVTYSEANGIVVTGDHVGPTVEDAPTTGDTPTTGDSTDLVALCAVMILSGTALVLLKKKAF